MTGADLIRNSSLQAERAEKMQLDRGAGPAASARPESSGSALSEDPKDALMRFARFIHKDKKERKLPPKRRQGLPTGYQNQINLNAEEPGEILNIII